jgi:hypothetical protein
VAPSAPSRGLGAHLGGAPLRRAAVEGRRVTWSHSPCATTPILGQGRPPTRGDPEQKTGGRTILLGPKVMVRQGLARWDPYLARTSDWSTHSAIAGVGSSLQ